VAEVFIRRKTGSWGWENRLTEGGIIPAVALTLRPARLADEKGPPLLYASAQQYYDAYAGSRERALRVLEAVWPKRGHTAAYDHCRLAVVDGTIAGALVAFPAEDGDALARRFLAVSLPRLGVLRWPGVLRHLRASAQVMPVPPARSLYVDALAVADEHRRAGVATALLDAATVEARQRGLRGVALDTGLDNTAAQALYEGYGFEREGERHAPNARVAAAIGGPGFVSYFKRT
jgi:ribosomal protein S18 acetylase RimI-like enzyme